MSFALNDSRAMPRTSAPAGSGTPHVARLASTLSSSPAHGAGDEGDSDDSLNHRRGSARVAAEEDENGEGGGSSPPQSPFILAHLLRRVRHDVQRHECQLAALAAEKHEHCEQLATVYAELEKVLRRIQLISPARRDELATVSSSPPLTTPAWHADVDDSAGPGEGDIASAMQQRVQELLQRHQERVYDVLADYRTQIDANARETDRRLRAMEAAIAAIHTDVRELRRSVSDTSEEARAVKTDVLERLELLDRQQEESAVRAAAKAESETRGARLGKALSKLQGELARVCADAAAMRDEQARRVLGVEEQVRLMLAAQERLGRSVEAHAASLVQLQAKDPLETSFHELKDWLGDLEKRMVSRGELLQWTETLQQEMHALRRLTSALPPRASDSASASLAGVEV